jgi:hypothetical protein
MPHRAAVLLSSLAITVAGCGGGGGSSASGDRAALDKWTSAADGSCKKANDAIAERGWPVSLVDLDRLAVRAISDVEDASEAIRHRKPPKGAADRVAPFVKSLEALEPRMDELSEATEDFKTAKLEDFLPELRGALLEVEKQSKRLGLRECAAKDEHVWVPDAIRAPVYAQQLALLDRRIGKRTKKLDRPDSPAEAARGLQTLSDILVDFDRGIAKLKPPYWAERAATRYIGVLRDLGSTLDSSSAKLSEGAPTLAEAKVIDRKLKRGFARERKAYKRLFRDIGAMPTLGGGGSGGEEEVPGTDGAEQS